MTDRRLFPEATTAQPKDYAYRISGLVTEALLRRVVGEHVYGTVLDHVLKPREVTFVLHVKEYSGNVFVNSGRDDDLWTYLASCHGLIYLFDPFREHALAQLSANGTGDTNRKYLSRTLTYTQLRVPANRRPPGHRLPQHLAVCIAKSDHPQVVGELDSAGLISVDVKGLEGMPVVTDAQMAFEHLAETETVKMIQTYFVRRRTRYFATSSIGFFHGRDDRVDPKEYWNFQDSSDGQPERIRGPIRPINVLSPLLWIENRVRSQ